KNIYVGQDATINIPSMSFATKGKIVAIIPSSNPMTHSFTVKLSFEKSANIYPGMYATVIIETK
ncbi:MAG: efflux RND transporter periplasmic adaptor subunit, partial [Arcobacteraceae bacterium]